MYWLDTPTDTFWLCGYSYFHPSPDRVMMNNDCATSGLTIVHELGHYFNLEHIWGDDNGACPGDAGYSDDGVNDTPIQKDENYGCPTFPSVSCSVSAPNGDMFMNYMDYCDDVCLTMFTTNVVFPLPGLLIKLIINVFSFFNSMF